MTLWYCIQAMNYNYPTEELQKTHCINTTNVYPSARVAGRVFANSMRIQLITSSKPVPTVEGNSRLTVHVFGSLCDHASLNKSLSGPHWPNSRFNVQKRFLYAAFNVATCNFIRSDSRYPGSEELDNNAVP